jgi:hypothetical protein
MVQKQPNPEMHGDFFLDGDSAAFGFASSSNKEEGDRIRAQRVVGAHSALSRRRGCVLQWLPAVSLGPQWELNRPQPHVTPP